ncbi:MAG: tyrosine-type recombinase/integrase [Candidatus Bathyarchaeia archaeon]|jgi:integrase
MQTDEPIHDYQRHLAGFKRSIKLLPNGETALCFLDHLGALGLSVARVTKYAGHLPVLLRTINVDLKTMSKADVEAVVASINAKQQKEWTKHDKKLTLRKLIQYAKKGSCAKGTPLPREVRWISLTVKEKDSSRVTPESLLTPEEFTAIIRVTLNKRDRAMIYVLFEAALRPGELLTMTIGSVVFKDGYCLITANGKTGIKRIPLVVSCKPLMEWIEEHPCRDNPEAPLWCSLASNYMGERLSYRYFRVLIKRLARKAGVKKDIWPYLYRHTTLTAMAKVFTESRLEQFAGWTYGSKMTRRYVHFSARDLEDAVLELHGLKSPEGNNGLARLVDCPRCGNKNPFGNVRCTMCGMVLDRETALKIEQTEQEKQEELTKQNIALQTRLEKLEGVISGLLSSQTETSLVH